MLAMPAIPSHLTINRHGTYHFRLVVPKPLRSAFGSQREIRRSLQTDSQRLALRRARQYAARYEDIFDRTLAVVDHDDYQATDDDYEVFLKEMGKVDELGLWSTDSSQAEPAPLFKSVLTDEEWQEHEDNQRRTIIAQALTGHAGRAIPTSQQKLAERLYEEGHGLPIRQFQKLLPKLIERIALHLYDPPVLTTSVNKEPSQPDGPTLYELWQQHWETLARLSRGRKKSERTKEDEQGHACRLNILSASKPINQFTVEDFECIYSEIFEVRPNRGSKLPSPDSPKDTILAKDGDRRIEAGTIDKLIIRLGVLHEFAFKKGLTKIHPDTPERSAPDHNPPGKKPVEKAFTKADLHAIFSGYLYTGTELIKSSAVFPYQFWLPVLGLYTGGRLNELCQLDTEDVSKKEPEGIWTISMMDDERDRPLPKSLKNQSSRRILPIHSELIRMGFLTFVEQAAKEGRGKLFSDGLTYSPKKGWGSNATHFFCRFPSQSTSASGYFFKCGIRERDAEGKTDGKNFHSFRHTFTDLARESGAEAYLVLPDLTGHSRGKEGQVAKYGNGFSQVKKQAVLEGLTIPVDLSIITYADFVARLGHRLEDGIQRHRSKHGLNQAE
ncbi:Phage integrase-like protein [Pseudomonas syringae pv. pisi]|uniref:Phage integrase-like protein n=2 Tax=Pseudomonas syringae group TaxID=136849 RepID=A0A3M3TNJ9_PSESJ|nr:Phage integrase-like protein [Pseudomonas syringae pv. pisi]RML66840.1 Phage integrase-like protein [Pseudomonas syringae pv. pisi]RMM24873.1 Phage integrase-like protein [Pseudomonas syringae pv. pisi]RMO22527.1 Phage integrase-like protein [Pseudomonas syringae pv. pisi]RMV62058.1 Phage integrase-like protein [Pseudomonas syringae pv. pisi]